MELKPMYAGINNSPKTTLISEISATAQSIEVADISVFPPAPNLATIGTGATAEVIRYNGISGATLTGCERGFDGTTPGVWRASEEIYRAFTKHDFETLQENITVLQAQLLELQEMIPAGLPSVSNPNLLDNWDFRSPVNQRGQTSYTGAGYAIDRWKSTTNLTVTIADGCISLANPTGTDSGISFMQILPLETSKSLYGETVTLSVKTKNGLLSNTCTVLDSAPANTTLVKSVSNEDDTLRAQVWMYATGTVVVSIVCMGSSADVVAAKLELGTLSTLANDPPMNYGEELRKCQYYFRRIKSQSNNFTNLGILYATAAGSGGWLVLHGIHMRIKPTASFSDISKVIITKEGVGASIGNATSLLTDMPYDGNSLFLSIIGFDNAEAGTPYLCWINDNINYLDLSADL